MRFENKVKKNWEMEVKIEKWRWEIKKEEK